MKTEDIKKMAQAWKQVQEAGNCAPKMKKEELKGDQHKIDHNKDGKISAADFKGLRKKAKKDQEVEVQTSEATVNELKKSTLASYVKKASGNMAGKTAVQVAKVSSSNGKGDPDLKRGLVNRMKGIGRAADKLAKEEVEIEENITKMSHSRLKFHLNGVPHGSYSNAEMKAERDRRLKTGEGEAYKKAKPSMSEEVEQIDELSTKTLGYYVRNAADDVRAKKAKPTGTVSVKDIKKVHSRNKNIDLALDKIGNKRNESVEEAATHKPGVASPAGEGLSPSAKKELARKTPMPDFVNEPKIDKKTFDTMRASGKKAKARSNDNAQGDKNIINKPLDITAKASKKEDDGFKDA